MRYTNIFFSYKNRKFHWNMFDILKIFAQSIDCGYTLEPPKEAVLASTHNMFLIKALTVGTIIIIIIIMSLFREDYIFS